MSNELIFHSYTESDHDHSAQIHFPAGRVYAQQWEKLAEAAEELGDGTIYLTSRAQCQIRGLSSPVDVEPCATVVSTPGHFIELAHDIAGAVRRELVIGLDAGDGAILRQDLDFAFLLVDDSFHLYVNGEPAHSSVGLDDVVTVLLQLSESPELSVETPLLSPTAAVELNNAPATPAPIGWLEHDGLVSLGAGIPGGEVPSRLARFIAVIEAETTITPWNSLIIHDLNEAVAEQVVKVLAPMGLVFDANSPLLEN